MPETTNNSQKTAKPCKPRTQRNTRKELVDRIIHDMTYKTGTPEQHEVYAWIATTFASFQQQVRHLFNYAEIPNRLVDTSQYFTYTKELRRAERWANGAVANDWTDDSAFKTAEAKPLKYPVEPGQDGTSERHKLCDEISRMTFELATLMAEYLPEGRHLSLFATQMQDVRGALLDTINENVLDPPTRARQAVDNNVEA